MKKTCAIVGVLIGIFVTGLLINAKKNEMQDELAEQVFRFHVLANSDSSEDQALKMKVKELKTTKNNLIKEQEHDD